MKKTLKFLGYLILAFFIWLILGMIYDPVFKFGVDIFLFVGGVLLSISDFILSGLYV